MIHIQRRHRRSTHKLHTVQAITLFTRVYAFIVKIFDRLVTV